MGARERGAEHAYNSCAYHSRVQSLLRCADCLFAGLSASRGSAIRMDSTAADSSSTLAVTNCTFRDNEANPPDTGSAIYIADAALRAEACSFAGNTRPEIAAQVRCSLPLSGGAVVHA